MVVACRVPAAAVCWLACCCAVLGCACCAVKWDAPHGQNTNRGFGITGWNRPDSLPPLDAKFNFEKAKKEAIERIKKVRIDTSVCSPGPRGKETGGNTHGAVAF